VVAPTPTIVAVPQSFSAAAFDTNGLFGGKLFSFVDVLLLLFKFLTFWMFSLPWLLNLFGDIALTWPLLFELSSADPYPPPLIF
jgi:hypothetical protein